MSEKVCEKCGSPLEEKSLKDLIKGEEKTLPEARPAWFRMAHDFDTDLTELGKVLVCTNPECQAIYPARSGE